jgi:hypothetical protein
MRGCGRTRAGYGLQATGYSQKARGALPAYSLQPDLDRDVLMGRSAGAVHGRRECGGRKDAHEPLSAREPPAHSLEPAASRCRDVRA